MSQPLGEYSKDAIGRNWTAADHRYLIEQLRRIDELAQDLWHYSRRNQSLGGQISLMTGTHFIGRTVEGDLSSTVEVEH